MKDLLIKYVISTILISGTVIWGDHEKIMEKTVPAQPVNCNFTVDAGPDIVICPDDPGQLQGSINGNYNTFRWEPPTGLSNPNSLTPTVNTNIDRSYTLIAEGTSSNLIVNGGFEDGSIAPASTGYAYSDPNNFIFAGDGSYTIGNNATLGNIWGCSPHGGNWAMAINGATGGGVDVWCQTVNVTPGADHRFEAWIMGITIPFMVSYANLEFSINGNVIGTLEAPANTCTWAPFMAMWNSGGSSTATVCIRNLNTSGTGNYCAIDDIALFEKCEVRDEVNVTVEQLIARVNAPPLVTCDMNPVPLDGTGSSSGPGYTYFWDTSDGEIVGPRTNIRTQASKPGTYTFTVTSPFGCSESVDIFLDGSVTPPDLSATGDSLSCDKPTAQLFASSSTPDVSFTWKGPDGFTSNDPSPIVADTGNYTVIVSDIYGCKDSITINVPSSGFLPTLDIQGDTIRCDIDTVLLMASSNANLPVFEWSGPGNFSGDSSIIVARDTGWYAVLLTDSTGCQTRDSFYVLSLARDLEPELTDDTISCADPSAILFMKNDSIASVFQWTGPNGFSSSDQRPLASDTGWYFLEVRDAMNCEGNDSLFISGDLDIPQATYVNDTLDCLDTIGKFIQFSSNGNYQYAWKGPGGFTSSVPEPEVIDTGSYQLIITGENGCSDTLNQRLFASQDLPDLAILNDTITCLKSTGILSGISSGSGVTYSWSGPNGFSSTDSSVQVQDTGSYTLRIIAPNGCTNSAQARLSGDLSAPVITSIPEPDTLTCINTSVTLDVQLQSGNFEIQWTGPGGFSSLDQRPEVTEAGMYRLTITGENGCSTTDSLTVYENTQRPDISAIGDTITCSKPEGTLKGSSSTNGVTYYWTGPNGYSSDLAEPVVSDSGTYTLVVTAPNGCTSEEQVSVELDADFPNVTPIAPDTLNCVTQTIDISAQASGNGLTYVWTEMGNPLGTDPNISITAPGNYTLAVTNDVGCTRTINFSIAIDTMTPTALFIVDTITCMDPEQRIQNLGHETGYSYEWAGPGGFASNEISPLVNEGGNYQVVITDQANGCSSSTEILVEDRSALPTSIETEIKPSACGEKNGIIRVLKIEGGYGPYEFSLDGGANFQVIPEFSDLGEGTYELIARDAYGCEINVDLTVSSLPGIMISLPPVINLNPGGTRILDVQTNKPISEIASIRWDPSDGLSCSDCLNPTVTANTSRSYTVTVTDIDGCTDVATVRIEVITSSSEVFVPNAFTPNDDGKNDVFRPSVASPPDAMVLQIFDRWGSLVFSAEQPWSGDAGWDGTGNNGKPLLPGVYVYRIILNYGGYESMLTGDVTLLR